MPTQNYAQTSFASGEVSPLLFGRPDLSRFRSGVAYSRNFYSRAQGGYFRRPGSIFLDTCRDETKKSVLRAFRFSESQAYVLEFSHLKLRVMKNRSFVAMADIVTPYTEADLPYLWISQSADVMYITVLNGAHPPYTLSRLSDVSWNFNQYVTEDGPYLDENDTATVLSLSSVSYTAIVTSDTAGDFSGASPGEYVEFYKNGNLILGEIVTVDSGTQVTVKPKDNVIDPSSLDPKTVIQYASPPNRLQSTLAIWSTESQYSFIKVGSTWRHTNTHNAQPESIGTPAYTVDVMDLQTDPVVHSTSGNLTYSDEEVTATLKSSVALFDSSTDVGRLFRLKFTDEQIWGTIDSFTSTTEVEVTLGRPLPLDLSTGEHYLNNAETTDWRLGAWYVGNYPSTVVIHEQRLIFSATPLQPQHVWMSESGDYVSFSPTNFDSQVVDSNAVTFEIGSNEVNEIVWMMPGPTLLIGTIGGEWQVRASTINEAITPTNVQIVPQTTYGSKKGIAPLKVGPATLFVQRDGRTLREMTYNFEMDSFLAKDLSIASEHLLRQAGGAVEGAFQSVPNQIYWLTTNDGCLVAMTYEKDQDVIGWHKHVLGGTDSFVESACVIPHETENQDELYVAVRRTVNNQTRRYIEVFQLEMLPEVGETDPVDLVYCDSTVEYDGASTTTITGLSHLEGEVVAINADGAVHPTKTVSGGIVTLNYAVTKAKVGLPYASQFRPLPIEAGAAPGNTAQGKTKKVVAVHVRLFASLGFEYGIELDKMTKHSFRRLDDYMDQAPQLKSGDFEIKFNHGYDREGQYWLCQTDPYPLNILAVYPVVKTNE